MCKARLGTGIAEGTCRIPFEVCDPSNVCLVQ